MSSLVIYILCHNRPDDARRAIISALDQTDRDFRLIISDNSTDDRVESVIHQEFPSANYIRRSPVLPALEHFNRCLEETSDSYVCLFHDDDLLRPDFVKEVKSAIASYPDAIAIGCNARIEQMGKLQNCPSFLSLKDHELITSPRDLARRYIARYQSGIAPFPGYVYRRQQLGSIRFEPSEGKYSDVTWLLRLAERGQIIWIGQPVMTYRIHGGNDGLKESRRDRLRFLAYVKRHQGSLGTDLLDDYRCSFIYKPMIQGHESNRTRQQKLANRFIRFYGWRRYLRPGTYRSALQRAILKRWGR